MAESMNVDHLESADARPARQQWVTPTVSQLDAVATEGTPIAGPDYGSQAS